MHTESDIVRSRRLLAFYFECDAMRCYSNANIYKEKKELPPYRSENKSVAFFARATSLLMHARVVGFVESAIGDEDDDAVVLKKKQLCKSRI